MSNLVRPAKKVATFYFVVEKCSSEVLSENGELSGEYSWGNVGMDENSCLTANSSIAEPLLDYINNCRRFDVHKDAVNAASLLQKSDPEGEYEVVTVHQYEAVCFTFG